MVGPKAKRRALEAIREKFKLSVRQSCRILGLRQSTYHYRPKMLLPVPSRPSELWAMDFAQDSFATGRKFRVLTLKYLFTHEARPLRTRLSKVSTAGSELSV